MKPLEYLAGIIAISLFCLACKADEPGNEPTYPDPYVPNGCYEHLMPYYYQALRPMPSRIQADAVSVPVLDTLGLMLSFVMAALFIFIGYRIGQEASKEIKKPKHILNRFR